MEWIQVRVVGIELRETEGRGLVGRYYMGDEYIFNKKKVDNMLHKYFIYFYRYAIVQMTQYLIS